MSLNDRVAKQLEEIAQMMEVLGEDSFRVNAHNRAARAVSGLSVDIAELAKDRKKLLEVEGIGPKLADKIIEACEKGTIAEHAALKDKVPAGVLDVLNLNGVGPKTAAAMWKTLGVDSLPKLRAAISDGTLLTLPRMGEKAVEKIKAALALAAAGEGRTRLGLAWPVAMALAESIRAMPGVAQVQPAGSLRRGRETVADIDIVVAMKPGHEAEGERVMERVASAPIVAQVLAKGLTKTSVRVHMDADLARWGSEETAANNTATEATLAPTSTAKTIQADVRVVPLASFGAALQYFTGSKEHNVRVRALAQQQGMTLNEWGLFKDDEWDAFREKKFKDDAQGHTQMLGAMPKRIAGATEEAIYAALSLSCPPPEVREDRGEVSGEVGGKQVAASMSDLITIADIRAELHAHTTASDGSLSIEELAREAHRRGFHTIAVTDHSQSSTIAGGLRPDRLRKHIKDVKAVHDKLHAELGLTVLSGSEVDILVDGTLDYADDLLAQLDVVVASPHAALTQDPATATKRLLKAISHPLVHILGHPTGRLILRRPGLEPAMAELIAAAKEHDVALEINAHWMRLDLRDTHVKAAVDAGCDIAINCDVHERTDFDNLRFGVMTARRGWLPKASCANTWTAKKLHAWLKRKR